MAKSAGSWSTFSLRTLFILMTVLCVWLGWELSIVRQRQNELRAIKESRRLQVTTAKAWEALHYPSSALQPLPATIPLVRRWMGDEAIQEFWYTTYGMTPFTAEERARVAKIFPEAEFREVVPEPCHPGCFPAGTLVETPDGLRPIEQLRVGDTIIALGKDDQRTPAPITSIFTTKNVLLEIVTAERNLLTTPTQPLCLRSRQIVPAKAIAAGDMLLGYENGSVRHVEVLDVRETGRTAQVFNVILTEGEYFLPGGFVARCKPPAETALTASP